MALEQFLLLFHSERISQRPDDAVIGELLPIVKLPPTSLNSSMDFQELIDATRGCQAVGLRKMEIHYQVK